MFKEWRKNFLTGLLTVLPLAITLGILVWFFKRIDNVIITQVVRLLPDTWIEITPIRIFWKTAALAVVIAAITLIGIITRNVLGRKLLELTEKIVNKVPFVNKIYTIIKEIRDTLVGGKREFNRVVAVEYPRKGIYTIGFLVNPAPHEACEKLAQSLLTIFLPTTPNPTSGLLILVPEKDVIHLKISVEEAMKLIISGGTIKL